MRITHLFDFIQFDSPVWLTIFAAIPVLIFLSRRSLAGLGPIRHPLAVTLRCGVFVCLLMALAAPNRVRKTDEQTIVFVLDRSRSVPLDRQQSAWQFVRQAAEKMRKGKDRIAVLGFDGTAVIDQAPRNLLNIEVVSQPLKPDQTNLASALKLAVAVFPPDTARRIVVLSDGNENVGDAIEEAKRESGESIPIDVVPLSHEEANEVIFEQITSPPTASKDEMINLNLTLRSKQRATGKIRLLHNDRAIDTEKGATDTARPVTLEPGTNRLTISVPVHEAGTHRFTATFEPDDPSVDTIATNNIGRSCTIVNGPQKILILTAQESVERNANHESATILAQALETQGITCEVETVGTHTIDSLRLLEYSSVILSNVPAYDLSVEEQKALVAYVRDLGGGLIAVGGDQSFSVGGYFQTPLEEVLPVATDQQKLLLLKRSFVIVIDRSGSMAGDKLEWAKQAAGSSVKLLNAGDNIGVIAFDGSPTWARPFGRCGDKNEVIAKISRIGLGGGTSLYPAMREAAEAFPVDSKESKHVLILTDGQSMPGDFEGITKRMANAGITVSTIAVGPDADRQLLNYIARVGKGRFYPAMDVRALPQIFARETILAGRTGVVEKPFIPGLIRLPNDMLDGFEQADIPELGGYVVMNAKPEAEVALVRKAQGNDPILAYWQIGLGRSVAFTSGMWSQWGPNWVSWSGFGKLWAQVCRWTDRPDSRSQLSVTTRTEGDQVIVQIEAAENPSADTLFQITGNVIDPNFGVQPLQVQRTGLGEFRAAFRTTEPGSYVVRLAHESGKGSNHAAGTIYTGVSVAYSPEYRETKANDAILTEMANSTKGRILSLAESQLVYDPTKIKPMESRRPIWEYFLRLALLLFLLDVAVRRLNLDPWLAVARVQSLIGRLPGRRAGAASVATLSTLRGVRDRVRETANETQTGSKSKTMEPQPSAGVKFERIFDQTATSKSILPPPVPKTDATEPKTGEDVPHTARLLNMKRRLKREQDQKE